MQPGLLNTVSSVIVNVTLLLWLSQPSAADSCAELDQRSAQIVPLSYCVVSDPGDAGGTAAIDTAPLTVEVIHTDPERQTRIDYIIPLTKRVGLEPTVTYSTTASWGTGVPIGSLFVAETMVSLPSTAAFTAQRVTQVPDKPELNDKFQWTLNEDGEAVGWKVNKRVVAIPTALILDHIHTTTLGLPPEENVTFHFELNGGTIYPNLDADLDGSGEIGADDFDTLARAIREQTYDIGFDFDGSGALDDRDLVGLVAGFVGALFGDANLDGQATFPDFLILSDNFSQPGTWSEGNFNSDEIVDFADFLLLADNFSGAAATQPVPEPSNAVLACILLVFACRWIRNAK